MKANKKITKRKSLTGEQLLQKAFTGNSKVLSERERKEKELKEFLKK